MQKKYIFLFKKIKKNLNFIINMRNILDKKVMKEIGNKYEWMRK